MHKEMRNIFYYSKELFFLIGVFYVLRMIGVFYTIIRADNPIYLTQREGEIFYSVIILALFSIGSAYYRDREKENPEDPMLKKISVYLSYVGVVYIILYGMLFFHNLILLLTKESISAETYLTMKITIIVLSLSAFLYAINPRNK